MTVRDTWRGRYALIGGTLCYDELGYPYLYRRWLIRYLDAAYGYDDGYYDDGYGEGGYDDDYPEGGYEEGGPPY